MTNAAPASAAPPLEHPLTRSLELPPDAAEGSLLGHLQRRLSVNQPSPKCIGPHEPPAAAGGGELDCNAGSFAGAALDCAGPQTLLAIAAEPFEHPNPTA